MANQGKAIDQQLIDAFYANTDAKYHTYIMVLYGKPYMQVHGKVAMAIDEHAAAGAKIHFQQPTFEDISGRLICRSIVISEIRGTGSGLAEVHFNSNNVAEKTSPLECAETSAIGRALTFLGYGCETGIASYEEVLHAIDNQVSSRSTPIAVVDDIMATQPVKMVANGNGHAPTNDTTPATEKQIKYLKSLLSQKGTARGHSDFAIAAVYGAEDPSKDAVREDIDELNQSDRLTPKFLAGYLRYLRESVDMSQQDILDYCKRYFNKSSIRTLDRAEQDQLIGWLLIGNADEESENSAEDDANADPENELDMAIERICEVSGLTHEKAVKYFDGGFPASWNQDKRREHVFDLSDEELTGEIALFTKRRK
jgi:hypothetical protein